MINFTTLVRMPGQVVHEREAVKMRNWVDDASYWRNALVQVARETSPSAFAGKNLLRVFIVGHSQAGVVVEPLMVLVDVPRNRVLMGAFVSFQDVVKGVGVPMRKPDGTWEFVGRDQDLLDKITRRVEKSTSKRGILTHGIPGPDGATWTVFTKEVSSTPKDFLEKDGHTLTFSAATQVKKFVEGVVIAAQKWLFTSDGDVTAHVQRKSPAQGPSLRQSLKG